MILPTHLIYLDQIVLGELGFSGIDVVDDLAEMIDVAFRVERISRNFKRNAVLPADLFCKDLMWGVFKVKMTEKQSMLIARSTLLVIAAIAIILARDPDSSVFKIVSFAWAGLRRGRSLVLTPHISTLYPAIIPP